MPVSGLVGSRREEEKAPLTSLLTSALDAAISMLDLAI
jgi:hypothetical protein